MTADTDKRIADALRDAQTSITTSLWTGGTDTTFTPAVVARSFGDGRALFKFTTIQNRPAYWLVRGCTSWTEGHDAPEGRIPFADSADEVVEAIEDEFGGTHHYDRDARGRYVDQETGERIDRGDARVEFPVIESETGCSWALIDWPDLPGIDLVPHPHERGVRVLAETAVAQTV